VSAPPTTTGQPLLPPYRPGDLIGGRYQVEAFLARGGTSEVYLCRDELLGREVVVKAPRFLRDPADLARFRREAEALATLQHPGVVVVHDVAFEPPHYLVEEYVRGVPLDALLGAGPLGVERATSIGAAVADALGAAHARGVIHRDIKPSNIIVSPTGIKVVDFGLAWSPRWPSVTTSGEINGTAAYISPEQARGGGVDARSDLYSLGVVLYEMLAGRPPFEGDSPLAMVHKHLWERPEPLRKANPQVPVALEAVVMACLAKTPRRRFGSATELASALRSLPADPSSTDRMRRATTDPLPDLQTRRKRRWVVLGAFVALALAAASLMTVFAPLHGNGRLSLVSAPPPVPAPRGLTAHADCMGFLTPGVALHWRASPGATGYAVLRTIDGTRWKRIAETRVAVTGYTDKDVGTSIAYVYAVRAVSGPRTSQLSRIGLATTPSFCFL
jgi:serine/threonine protein kinase